MYIETETETETVCFSTVAIICVHHNTVFFFFFFIFFFCHQLGISKVVLRLLEIAFVNSLKP